MGRDLLATTAKKLEKRIQTTYDLDKEFRKFGLSYAPLDYGHKSILFRLKDKRDDVIYKYKIVSIPQAKKMLKELKGQR